MQFRTIRINLAAGVVGALTAATLGLSATPASAAEVHCANFTTLQRGGTIDGGSLYIHRPSTTPESGNYNCVVARGDHNWAVRALQETLNTCYKQGLKEDSDFGPATEQAVRNVQIALNNTWHAGLSEDGRFGPLTSSWFSFKQFKADGTATNSCY
ncbi:peptidoglycan-binding protein [Streptomyces sp. NPDC002574]|uniref:peptidoglycan-binding domain-containing protein n=1 Tax=Streptomyces sp. NPDC002574 TaxID=3364652 RepID=UPI003690B0D9